jgi:hypothetical protein
MGLVLVSQDLQKIETRLFNNYENRGESVRDLIYNSVRYGIKKYNNYPGKEFEMSIWTGDRPSDSENFSFSTVTQNYQKTFPCFAYDSWPACNIQNYHELINSFEDTIPLSNKIGWIGAITGEKRRIYIDQYQNTPLTEAITLEWNREDPDNLWKNTSKYLSFQEQINKWKYLLDIEGAGYSARLKILVSSPRIVFIVDNPYKEWWHEFFIPWKHYVPIKEDLSDLEQNYNIIENDLEIQKYIKQEQKKFALEYLTKEAAYEKIYNILLSFQNKNTHDDNTKS